MERHERETYVAQQSRGSAYSPCVRTSKYGAVRDEEDTSLWRLSPRQVNTLFKLQMGDPDEEFTEALGRTLAALGIDQDARVLNDSFDPVKCSLRSLSGGPPVYFELQKGGTTIAANQGRAQVIPAPRLSRQQNPTAAPYSRPETAI